MSDGKFTKLRVFISWSGERSKEAAQALRDWLPSVLQNVKPYFTPDDIEKGSRWGGEIRGELEASDFGIICLTQDNLSAPWILFEAGALSKLDKSRVAPLLLDVEPADVTGPLGQLQLTRFSKDECLKLLTSLNRALGELGLDQPVLAAVFERWWPELEERIKNALATHAPRKTPKRRPERDILEEVLERVRMLQMRGPPMPPRVLRHHVPLPRLAEGGPIEEIPIARLPISPRGIECLEGVGIRHLGELLQMSSIDLLKVPNLGKRCQVEIMELLESYGLSLKKD
jgi:hypothetical protein